MRMSYWSSDVCSSDLLWDRARFLMNSEANFAVLSRSPGFPVAVPTCLFADVESRSGTGLIISECIPYGRNGVEPLYPKCMDYQVPEQVSHYKAILRGLAKLSGTHRAGRLAPDFGRKFPYDRERSSAVFALSKIGRASCRDRGVQSV